MSREAKLVLSFFSFLLALSLIILYCTVSNFKNPLPNWESAVATVTKVEKEQRTVTVGFRPVTAVSTTEYRTSYTYVVDGIDYEGQVFIPTNTYVGDTINILYNPEIPEQSTVQ